MKLVPLIWLLFSILFICSNLSAMETSAKWTIASYIQVDNNLNSLDNMMSGFMVLHLYSETGIEKYKLACDSIRKRYDTYPRTSEGAFWHTVDRQGELWLDGLYMSMPFTATYGKMFNDEENAYDEVVKQFSVYLGHLMNDQTGIPLHALS